MKKTLLLALALLILCSACAAAANPTGTAAQSNVNLTVMGDSNPMPGFDAQNAYSYMAVGAFRETEDFYLGNTMSEPFLHYYDKATGISGYLCADPSCTHTDAGCGAFFAGRVSMFWYDNQRWYISQAEDSDNSYFLYRSDLSGINRERIKRLNWDTVILPFQPQQYAIHRGNLFARGVADTVVGTQVQRRCALLASPLDGTEEFAVLFDQTIDDGLIANNSVRFVGTKVYYTLTVRNQDNQTDITITSYDLVTQEYETVYHEAALQFGIGEPWVAENGEIYLCGFDETYTAYFWKLENNQRVALDTWQGEKYGMPYLSDGVIINVTWIEGIRGLEVRDFSGNVLVNTDTLFPEEIPGIEGDPNKLNFNMLGGDREKVVMSLSKGNHRHTLLIDIRDGVNIIRLWSTGE